MVLKKLMVGCLIASMLVSGGGTVLAGSVDSVGGDVAGVMSEYAGIPKTVNGDVVLNVTGATLTGSMIQEKLEALTVYDSDGNALDYSVQLCRDGKYKEFTYDEGAEYINSLIEAGSETVYLCMYAEDEHHTYVDDSFIVNVVDDVVEEPAEEVTGNITYTTHVQNVGWQNAVADGDMSGTEGKGLRLEGIKIESGIEGLGVSYSTHVENIGWQNAVSDGELSGTSGQGLRLEAITIELTGDAADNYDVYYSTHVQNVGWMDWAYNGEESGSSGYGYRLEGIKIEIVEKGTSPSSLVNGVDYSFKDGDYKEAYVQTIKTLKSQYAKEYGSELSSIVERGPEYGLFDVNCDNIPELFVLYGICTADYHYLVYSYSNGDVIDLGSMSRGMGLYGVSNSKSGDLIGVWGHQGQEMLFNIYMDSDTTITADMTSNKLVPGDYYSNEFEVDMSYSNSLSLLNSFSF